VIFLLVAVIIFLPLSVWFGCRIEPGTDKIAILIKKTGENLSSGQILALNDKQKKQQTQ
jgi:hypothetical protein